MIRFCDKNIKQIEKIELDEEFLKGYYSDNKHADDVIVIFDEGISTGYVEKSCVEDGTLQIVDEYVVVNSTFWITAHNFFERNPKRLLMVTSIDGEVLTFCYDDPDYNYFGGDFRVGIEQLLRIPDISYYIKEYDNNIEAVNIYEFNEYTYELYEVISKSKIDVYIYGRLWKYFGINNEKECEYADYKILNIYSEGTCYIKKECESNSVV